MTELSFIVEFPEEFVATENAAKQEAISVMRGCEDWFGNYYDNLELRTDVEPCLEVDSAEAQDIINNLLEKTKQKKGRLLKDIINRVEDADSVEEAATTKEVFHDARRLGSWRQPSGFLIDGTRYQHGEPILSQETAEKIVDNINDGNIGYLVNLNAYY